MLAPIVLFVYNRPEKVVETISALQRNLLAQQSELFVFSDGPKVGEDISRIREVRHYIGTVSGFKKVHIVERSENFGLARSVISGVTEIVEKFGRVIVIEDDMITSPYFLKYMNEALDLYENEEKVISVHGYVYPVSRKLPEFFFLRGADCWGWATWKRGWQLFESDAGMLLDEIEGAGLARTFDFDGAASFTEMLRLQKDGKIDSWAIRWNASAFLKNRLTLYPGRSLVINTGTDGTGTHGDNTAEYLSQLNTDFLTVYKTPVEESERAYKAFAQFFDPNKRFLQRLIGRFKGK